MKYAKGTMRSRLIIAVWLVLLPLSGLSGEPAPGDTLVVRAVTWSDPSPEGWGAPYRTLVEFPAAGRSWAQILMVQTLKCDSSTRADRFPCGEWDYICDTVVKVPKVDSLEDFSLASFVTPYGKGLDLGGEEGWRWVFDVTDFAPILTGKRELVTGNNQELLDLRFLFVAGTPPREVLKVENLYPHGNYKYRDLAADSVLRERTVVLSPEAAGYSLLARISGHGHHGPYNCCEWDGKRHIYYLNHWPLFSWRVWKDCGHNPLYPQGGTWPFDRAGWCPGTAVDEHRFELTPLVTPGDTVILDYGIENFRQNGEADGEFRESHLLFSYGPLNFNVDAALLEIIAPNAASRYRRDNPLCGSPRIVLANHGRQPLRSVQFLYGYKGYSRQSYTWFGDLEFPDREEVILPPPEENGFPGGEIFAVELTVVNGMESDENPLNNHLRSRVLPPPRFPAVFRLLIRTNNLGRARENSWWIASVDGGILYRGDFLADDTTYQVPVSLPPGCYHFEFSDAGEDGISVHWWSRKEHPQLVGKAGRVLMLAGENDTLWTFPADFGDRLNLDFVVP